MKPRRSARDLLIESAETVFYERGLGATNVNAVAQAAGVSKPTLYAHFPSKDELAAAALRHRHERRSAELEAWLAEVEDPAERPLAVFSWLIHWYGERGRRGCAFLNAAAEVVDAEAPVRQAVQAEKTWLLELLTGLCAQAGAARHAHLASQLLLLIDGVAGRVVVQGPQAAARATAEAADAAAVLIAAAVAKS
ncbi:TetR/AcrR family transcriptional regulator [Streptomyces sp. 2A115]|uniref:TetR/AcrR family transcriptional regulator n=1 Tax=Streptomyces sp. 2A115 TaxID=3457439 RepID=UPI003FD30D24